jgi:hypothetical protein
MIRVAKFRSERVLLLVLATDLQRLRLGQIFAWFVRVLFVYSWRYKVQLCCGSVRASFGV